MEKRKGLMRKDRTMKLRKGSIVLWAVLLSVLLMANDVYAFSSIAEDLQAIQDNLANQSAGIQDLRPETVDFIKALDREVAKDGELARYCAGEYSDLGEQMLKDLANQYGLDIATVWTYPNMGGSDLVRGKAVDKPEKDAVSIKIKDAFCTPSADADLLAGKGDYQTLELLVRATPNSSGGYDFSVPFIERDCNVGPVHDTRWLQEGVTGDRPPEMLDVRMYADGNPKTGDDFPVVTVWDTIWNWGSQKATSAGNWISQKATSAWNWGSQYVDSKLQALNEKMGKIGHLKFWEQVK